MKKLIFKVLIVIPVFLILNCSFLTDNCFSQWEPNVRLTNNPASSYTSLNNARCIAASGNVVHVVWYDNRDGNDEIYYNRSTDNGLSWGSEIRFTYNDAESLSPSIAVSGSVVHLVWHDERDGNPEIYYKRSTDEGVSWGADTRLTNNPANSWYPSVTVSGLVVHVVWDESRDGDTREIYYKRSTDGGVSWSADTQLTNDPAYSWGPSVIVSGSFVHVVWWDERDGNLEIYYKRSTDAGVSWSKDTQLTNNTADSWHPSVTVSGSIVHVAWMDNRDGQFEIYYKRSTDAGVSWSADIRLTNDNAYSWQPSVTVSGSAVHIVWKDTRDGNEEIYYKCSTDGGMNWGADIRLTNNNGISQNASVSVSGSVVHVIWTDNSDGNDEIYYKRNPNGNSESCNTFTVDAGNDAEIYSGYGPQSVQLTANASGGGEPYSYLWTPGGATTPSITVSPTTTTSYVVQSSNSYQCITVDTVIVYFYNTKCGNNDEKILVCHNGITICISPNAVPAHLAHGDHLGSCNGHPDNYQNQNPLPKEYKLYSNYPNPFNPLSTIKFDLPKNANTRLMVYDIEGREVSVLVDGYLKAGSYIIDWNGSNFPSGVYFYRLTTENYSETKKMILMK